MFPSQMTAATEELRRWKKPTEEALAFFISFSPMAPMFGVDYRFAEYTKFELPAMPPLPGAQPATVSGKTATAKPKSSAPEKPVTKAVAKAADKAAPAPAEQPAPAAAAPAPAPAIEAEAETPAADTPATKPAMLLAKAPAASDDLKMIKGVGPSLEKQLNGLGIYTFEQIAAMSESDLAWVDDNLTAFKGRCFRDDWVGQAASLKG